MRRRSVKAIKEAFGQQVLGQQGLGGGATSVDRGSASGAVWGQSTLAQVIPAVGAPGYAPAPERPIPPGGGDKDLTPGLMSRRRHKRPVPPDADDSEVIASILHLLGKIDDDAKLAVV